MIFTNRIFSCLLTLTGASLFLINSSSVQAATINYDFDVSIDSGALVGQTFSGNFSFDDVSLTGTGSEVIPIDTINFDFSGNNFTEADDPFAEVEFLEGNFLGLGFSPDPSFSIVPGFFALSESFFNYDVDSVGSGAGDINYTLVTSQSPSSVPEPTSVIGLLCLGALAINKKIK